MAIIKTSNCLTKHRSCLLWARDGGLERCNDLLLLDFRTGYDITKDDWYEALTLVLGKVDFRYYGRSFEPLEYAPCGSEIIWKFIVKFSSDDLVMATQYIKRGMRYGVFGLDKKMETAVAGMSYEQVTCLRRLLDAGCKNAKHKNRCSFGHEEVVSVINREVKWYSQYKQPTGG